MVKTLQNKTWILYTKWQGNYVLKPNRKWQKTHCFERQEFSTELSIPCWRSELLCASQLQKRPKRCSILLWDRLEVFWRQRKRLWSSKSVFTEIQDSLCLHCSLNVTERQEISTQHEHAGCFSGWSYSFPSNRFLHSVDLTKKLKKDCCGMQTWGITAMSGG